MTLLSACQGAAKAAGLAAPSTVYGSTDPNNALLFAAAEEEIESLARHHDWTVLQREHTFSTVANTPAYALPSDFGRFIDFTAWDRSDYEAMRGPLSPAQWQAVKSSVLGSSVTINRRWRVKYSTGDSASMFYLDPTPDSAANLVFEYVTSKPIVHSGSAVSAWAGDSDTTLLDEWLLRLGIKWRVLERLGLAYAEARDEYERERDKAVARDGGMPALSLSVSPRGEPHLLGLHNVPDTGFGL